jgi:hypothetical protein
MNLTQLFIKNIQKIRKGEHFLIYNNVNNLTSAGTVDYRRGAKIRPD